MAERSQGDDVVEKHGEVVVWKNLGVVEGWLADVEGWNDGIMEKYLVV